jgi:hypothetical protein
MRDKYSQLLRGMLGVDRNRPKGKPSDSEEP